MSAFLAAHPVVSFLLALCSLCLAAFFFHVAKVSRIWHRDYGGAPDKLNAAINDACPPDPVGPNMPPYMPPVISP